MNEPNPKPEENPYLVTQVADVTGAVSDRKSPGPVAVFAVLLGAATAIVTFCVTFFFTCLGLTGPGGSSSSPGVTFSTVLLIAIATAILVTCFAVWGFLKILRALKS
jgi:hypothetical protein